jgi:hypothetical protein
MSIEVAAPNIRRDEFYPSTVSWTAVISGAAISIAVLLILLSLGSGLGLIARPGLAGASSVAAVSLGAGLWLVLSQWAAAVVCCYMTGRLRAPGIYSREMSFRDTAHGLLTWALAIIIVAIIAAHAGTGLIGERNSAQAAAASLEYRADMLFRPGPGYRGRAGLGDRLEAGRILDEGLAAGTLTEADHDYLIKIVAANTGISPLQAKDRLDAIWDGQSGAIKASRETGDATRKATGTFSVFMALSLLVGALIACIATAIGGQRRDLRG